MTFHSIAQDLPLSHGYGLTVRNVNDALPVGLQLLKQVGQRTDSRAGEVLRVPGPVFTVYERPTERVLVDTQRDANPFFHLIESMWILSGSNSVELPSYFLSSILNYSDDGKTFHGAYGYRLRHWGAGQDACGSVGFDQLREAIALLRENQQTRQVVCSIWDPMLDLGAKTKDVPCNDMLMFDIVDGALNMTVCNRSNDVIWGAYGANAVQFSVIQEYVAVAAGVKVGKYIQMSNNYHVYTSNKYWIDWLNREHDHSDVYNPYESRIGDMVMPLAKDSVDAAHLIGDCELIDRMAQPTHVSVDLHRRMSYLADGMLFHSTYFRDVVQPMMSVYVFYKDNELHRALDACKYIASTDWQFAAQQWVQKRIEARRAAI